MSNLKKKFRSIKKFPTWIYWLPARLLQLALHILFRFESVDPENWAVRARGMIGVSWHNRLFFFAVAFPAEIRKRTCAVVSASRDGQYIADFISILGLRSLRGSSSKSGARAQHQAVNALREGLNVCFTPDGPRGPKYQMKNGPVQLASLTQAKILPLSINFSRCWSVKSWDNFQIPKPFCKVRLVFGSPVEVPPGLSREEMELYRKKAEDALMAITVDPVSLS
jgi:lysophospholipid acyltransferase (LPLAT)-like uncharacterized protein